MVLITKRVGAAQVAGLTTFLLRPGLAGSLNGEHSLAEASHQGSISCRVL